MKLTKKIRFFTTHFTLFCPMVSRFPTLTTPHFLQRLTFPLYSFFPHLFLSVFPLQSLFFTQFLPPFAPFSPKIPLSYTLNFPYIPPTLFYLLKTTLAFPCSLQRISIKHTGHSLLSPYPLQQAVHLTPSCPSPFYPSTHLLFFILWSFYYRCYNMLYTSFYSTKTQV